MRPYYGALPPLPELQHLSIDELAAAVSKLRGQFMWLDTRRRRMYQRPLPLYAYDPLFCRWIRSLPDGAIRSLGARYLDDWTELMQTEVARARLALLRPLPLEMLRAFYVYQCAQTDALAGCQTTYDVKLEYATLYLAIHGCRELAGLQRENVMHWKDSTPPPAATEIFSEPAEGRMQWLPAAVDLQTLPDSVVINVLQMVKQADDLRVEPLRWRPVVGPKCQICELVEREHLPLGPLTRSRPTFPPFRPGCSCEVVFDPENDPYIEAPWGDELRRWPEATLQSMRLVLAAAERDHWRRTAESAHFDTGHDEVRRELARQCRTVPSLAALWPRVAKAIGAKATP
ncbi:MAG: hypothetical protein H6933_10850 [Burkholderiaceae bacterium]|nr:hypothetical protein [Burkholderiaceae bacterium]